MRNPLSIEAFADWLEKQPPEGEYDYCSFSRCAISQYCRWLGFKDVWTSARIGFELAHHAVVDCDPQTFGAAAARAREAINARA